MGPNYSNSPFPISRYKQLPSLYCESYFLPFAVQQE